MLRVSYAFESVTDEVVYIVGPVVLWPAWSLAWSSGPSGCSSARHNSPVRRSSHSGAGW